MKRYIRSNQYDDVVLDDDVVLEAESFFEDFILKNSTTYPGLSIELKDVKHLPYAEKEDSRYFFIAEVGCNNISSSFEFRFWLYELHSTSFLTIKLQRAIDSRLPKKNSNPKNGSKILQKLLDSISVDQTVASYTLTARKYNRYGYEDIYTKNFKCRGDYLAYFSMKVHKSPTLNALLTWWDDVEELEEFMEDYPTLKDIRDHASTDWYGDGDDWIIELKNNTTGEILYENDDYYDEEEDY